MRRALFACAACALLLPAAAAAQEVELDEDGNPLIMHAGTFEGASSGWARDAVELEAVMMIKNIDGGILHDLLAPEGLDDDGEWDYDTFDDATRSKIMESFAIGYPDGISIDEVRWTDDAHEAREGLPYVWLTIERGRYDINERRGYRRLTFGENTFDDHYFDTDDLLLYRNRMLIRGRKRWNENIRLLIALKLEGGVDADGIKSAPKVDQRGTAGSDPNRYATLDQQMRRGRKSWDGRLCLPLLRAYRTLRGRGLLEGRTAEVPSADGGTAQIYTSVLAIEPKVFLRSRRNRYHLNEVRLSEMEDLHELGSSRLRSLVAMTREALGGQTEVVVPDSHRERAEAFVSEANALVALGPSVRARLIDALAAAGHQVTDAELDDLLPSADRTPVPGDLETLVATAERVERRRVVADALSELYHEVAGLLDDDTSHSLRRAITGSLPPWELVPEDAERMDLAYVGERYREGLPGDYVSGDLPPGIALDGDDRVRGIPTETGTWVLRVRDGQEELDAHLIVVDEPDWDKAVEEFVDWRKDDFEDERLWRTPDPFVEIHMDVMNDPAALAEYNQDDDVDLDMDQWRRLRFQLRNEQVRIWKRQIEAAGTVLRGLWFDEAARFYVPGSRRNTGNFIIDTVDFASMYSPSVWGDTPELERTPEVNLHEQPYRQHLLHSVVVNEVQIELNESGDFPDRIRELRATYALPYYFMQWANAEDPSVATSDAFKARYEELTALTDEEMALELVPFNDFVREATGAGPGTAGYAPEELRDWLDPERLTQELFEADPATAFSDEDLEVAVSGARFVYQTYQGALPYLAELKGDDVIDEFEDEGAPEDVMTWEPAEGSKGFTALGFIEPEQPPGGSGGGLTGAVDDAADDVAAADNHDLASAAAIARGAYPGLELAAVGEEDWYALELAAGESAAFRARFSHAEGDLDLSLHAADGSRLRRSQSTADEETFDYTATAAETVYLRVYGYQGATGDYDLTVE